MSMSARRKGGLGSTSRLALSGRAFINNVGVAVALGELRQIQIALRERFELQAQHPVRFARCHGAEFRGLGAISVRSSHWRRASFDMRYEQPYQGLVPGKSTENASGQFVG